MGGKAATTTTSSSTTNASNSTTKDNNDGAVTGCSPSAAATVAVAGLGESDEKSHTFRKRRLSLSKHHLGPEPSSDSAVPPLPVVTTEAHGDGEGGGDHEGDDDVDQKAHTFRKRRLSLTLNAPLMDEPMQEVEEVTKETSTSETSQGVGGGDEEEVPRRPRRASDASAASLGSSGNHRGGLKVRTLHAGEILHQLSPGPPSSALLSGLGATGDATGNSNNQPHVLYRLSRPPSSTTLLDLPLTGHYYSEDQDPSSPQPKWKKRITRKHDEDERKLPFPRDVVGTYSCHGVEPVYDSDYEHGLEEDDIDDEDFLRGPDSWTEDISQAHKRLPTPHVGKPNITGPTILRSREPKPTTAAKINQDRGGVAFPYGNCPRTALFAAYDGHGQGGELVSQFALHEIQSRLEKRPNFQSNLPQAFKDTFLAVDEALKHEPLIEPLYAGTTACVALLRDNVLTVANAGDSRAVIARRKKTSTVDNPDEPIDYEAIDLTVDQNPDLPEEKLRIESMGGFVSPPPEEGLSARVWLDEGFSQIGLAMSRSIGDHAVSRVGVIAEPVVTTHTIDPDDEFLIIATDGVWEFLSSQHAVEIVGANLSRGATKATQALIEAAADRWHDEEGDYRDDITALVIRLPELWKQDRQHSSGSSETSSTNRQPAPASSSST